MTAPEPTPTAEHIDAVARAIDPDIFDPTVKRSSHPAAVIQIAARKHMATIAARNVLTSTDPAVHLAMLDALARAGVLTAEDAPIYRAAEHHHWQQRWDGEHTHEGGRYVTPWEVAP